MWCVVTFLLLSWTTLLWLTFCVCLFSFRVPCAALTKQNPVQTRLCFVCNSTEDATTGWALSFDKHFQCTREQGRERKDGRTDGERERDRKKGNGLLGGKTRGRENDNNKRKGKKRREQKGKKKHFTGAARSGRNTSKENEGICVYGMGPS